MFQTADAMLALGIRTGGGIAFKSNVEGDLHTDCDVGAAGTLSSLTELSKQFPEVSEYREVAIGVGHWLLSASEVSKSANGTTLRKFPDYANGPRKSQRSTDIYTSYDDGAAGVAKQLFDLYDLTGIEEFMTGSLESLNWLFSVAEAVPEGDRRLYEWAKLWRWDMGDKSQPFYLGIGDGVTGVINTLASFYERLRGSRPDMAAKCKHYMIGGLNYLEDVKATIAGRSYLDNQRYDAVVPETDPAEPQDQTQGNTALDSGWLSGEAGLAYTYLNLHRIFGDEQNTEYLDKAEHILFGWMIDKKDGPLVELGDGSLAWKHYIDPQGGNNPDYPTGFEEGNAGIAWVYLQGYKLTKQQKYLDIGTKAMRWLANNAFEDDNHGYYWVNYENRQPADKLVTMNLDNGNNGITMVFHDYYLVTKDKRFDRIAWGSMQHVMNRTINRNGRLSRRDSSGYANGDSGKPQYYWVDASYHWGFAGDIMTLTHMHFLDP